MAESKKYIKKFNPESFTDLINEYIAAGGDFSENIGKSKLTLGTYTPPVEDSSLGNININPYNVVYKPDDGSTIFHEIMHMLDDRSAVDYIEKPMSNEERAAELDIPLDAFLKAQEQEPNHPLWGNQRKTLKFRSDKLKDLSKKQKKSLNELFEDLAYGNNLNKKRTKYITRPTEFVSFATEGSDTGFYDDLEDMFNPFKTNTPEGGEKSIHDLVRLAENVNKAFDIGKENIKGGKDIFSSKNINFLNSYLENSRNKYLILGDSQKKAKSDNLLEQIQDAYNERMKWVTTKYGSSKQFVPYKSPNKYNLPQKYDKPWY